MSGNIVLPDPSGVNPYDTDQRRLYMEKVFRSQDLWDNLNQRPKFPTVRKLAEEDVCEMLDEKGFHNAGSPFFEWAVDESVWLTVFTWAKIDLERAPWPFADRQIPSARNLSGSVSRTYRSWRQSRGLSIEEPEGGKPDRAHRFKKAPEESKGNMSAVTANTPQPPAGQTASSHSHVSQNGPASVQAQPSPTADVIPRGPAPKQEMDDEDHMMTSAIDPSIPSWPLPATRDNRTQRMQEPSDADRGFDGARSSGRWPKSDHGQGTPGGHLVAPIQPLPSREALAIERLQSEFQELRETNTWIVEELRDSKAREARSARIIEQMRIELNAIVKILQTPVTASTRTCQSDGGICFAFCGLGMIKDPSESVTIETSLQQRKAAWEISPTFAARLVTSVGSLYLPRHMSEYTILSIRQSGLGLSPATIK
ncbi:uncharacterized protein FIESC28_04952 [Fusarium coffeatum]|uniref:Uncharacterized protein n=1 Tax=Fusarium coffeatum TaxID=231269 RepID=A0A366RYH7_9HYPO|nr:uncharacterized protein FIESC28_04952 [Fusarium coffeatum]RBR21415.1 hypothetical protein FIESC28_04952 [Fusarium coffeatum]